MIKTIGDVRIMYLMAAREEYGEHLQKRFTPYWVGIGPVEAAMNTARALVDTRPDIAVSIGSAGSDSLKQGQVYQASSVSYRDMDASPIGFPKGETPFLGLPAALPLVTPFADLPIARLSTGGGIINGDAYRNVDAEMVDMETFAIKRCCMTADVELIALRGISDGDADLRSFSDWTQYLGAIDERLAHAVDSLEQMLRDGTVSV
jgi:adenosylhomocysteine nucleosidase